MNLRYLYNGVGLLLSVVITTGCYDPTQKGTSDNMTTSTELEYAPQMYHSEAYEPMTQITDKKAGLQYWPFENVGTDSALGGQPHGEWYNSNYFNEYGMNMRTPPANTIRYKEYTTVKVAKDSFALAAEILVNPYKAEGKNYVSEYGTVTAKECKEYYLRFCSHCHGDKGEGDGLVGDVYGGVANLKRPDLITVKDGHIYHVITEGKGRMYSHASQIEPLERWMIVNYVRELQK
jgi:mono/diheme cytochrome c family protein